MTENLNTFYSEIGRPLRELDVEEKHTVNSNATPEFRLQPINTDFLMETWKSVKNKGGKNEDATGLSLLMLTLLLCVQNVQHSLTCMFNQFIVQYHTPIVFKTSIITPLVKDSKKSTTDFNNLRPIYIIPGIARLYEKIVHSQLSCFLEKKKFFSKYQFGFRKGHSTEHTVLAITDIALKAMDDKKVCVLITLDLKKAFNSVFRDLLILKLIRAGIDPRWFIDYLDQRYQQVKHAEKSYSQSCSDKYGIPQGTVLGPLLFSIFINDLPQILEHTTAFLFADDSILTITGYPAEIPDIIQKIESDINLVFKWKEDNSLQLNSDKTECIVIGSPSHLKQIGSITILVNETEIISKERIKILGVIIDNKLTWSDHLRKLEAKCYINLRPLFMLRPLLTNHNIITLINSLVLSNLNYMCSVWGTCSKVLQKRVEKIIRTSARLVLGLNSRDTVKHKITNDLKWLLPEFMYKKAMLCNIYKLVNYDYSPDYFKDQIKTMNQIHTHATRSELKIYIPFIPKTNNGQRMFTYTTFNLWNNLTTAQHSMSYQVFKKSIKNVLLLSQSQSSPQ